MLSTVFNPCFDVLSGFFSAWNERGWIVKHQGNLKSDYQIFFFCLRLKKLLTYFLSSTVWFNRSVAHHSHIYKGKQPNFRTFAQFLFKLFLSYFSKSSSWTLKRLIKLIAVFSWRHGV